MEFTIRLKPLVYSAQSDLSGEKRAFASWLTDNGAAVSFFVPFNNCFIILAWRGLSARSSNSAFGDRYFNQRHRALKDGNKAINWIKTEEGREFGSSSCVLKLKSEEEAEHQRP